MVTHEQLEAAKRAEANWRRENVTGEALSPAKRAESKALMDELKRLTWGLARQEFDKVQAPSVVLEVDEDAVTCRLPMGVLVELLICHEAGISDEEHMAIALSRGPEAMVVLKQILELAGHVRPK